jgi:hypothetical protein
MREQLDLLSKNPNWGRRKGLIRREVKVTGSVLRGDSLTMSGKVKLRQVKGKG